MKGNELMPRKVQMLNQLQVELGGSNVPLDCRCRYSTISTQLEVISKEYYVMKLQFGLDRDVVLHHFAMAYVRNSSCLWIKHGSIFILSSNDDLLLRVRRMVRIAMPVGSDALMVGVVCKAVQLSSVVCTWGL
ncbi:unnamed protein product [Lathyrus oleraceus]